MLRLQSPLTRYGLALATTGFSSLLFFLIRSQEIGSDVRCFGFTLAVLVSALLGGLGPGLLATGLSALANAYLFLPPIFSFHIDSEERIARLILFAGEGILVVFVGCLFRDVNAADIEISWKRYLPALLFVSTATGLKLLVFGSLEHQLPFTFFYAAITASAWSGGFGPGLLATLLASLAARYFFLDPRHSLTISSVSNAERVFLFIAEGIFISSLAGRYAATRRIASAAIGQMRLYEQRLKRSIEDVRALRLTTNDVVWEWDLVKDRMIRGATRVERPETPVAAMSFSSWLDQIHPDDRSAVSTSLEFALREGQEEWLCEYRRLRPGGKFAYVSDHAYVFRDSARNPVRVVGRTEDVSKSKRASRLPVAGQQYPTVLEANPLAVLVTDGGLHVVIANHAAADVLGYSPAELLRIHVGKLFLPERRPRIMGTLLGLDRLHRSSVTLEEDCVRGDGEIFRAKVNSAAITDTDGNSTGRMIMIEHFSG